MLATHVPKGSRKVLPVSGKVRVLNFIRKGEKPNAEVAKIYEVGSGDW